MLIWIHIIVLLFALNTIVAIILENRRPADTIAWMLLLFFIPILGLLLFYLFGTRANRHCLIPAKDLNTLKAYTTPLSTPTPTPSTALIPLLQANNHAVLTAGNHIEIYTTFRDMLDHLCADIAQAKDHIHFQFFKFENDAVGEQISDLLIQKAQQGIKVRIIYDAAACWYVPPRFYRRLRAGGVEVEPFNRLFPYISSFSNYRNHRKVVVIDGHIGYMGGMNIAERYLTGIRIGVWRDTHFRLVGPAVAEMQVAFLSDWHFAAHQIINDTRYFPIRQEISKNEGAHVQIVTSNPTDPWRVMNQAIPRLIAETKQYVYLQSPYFIPTDPIMNALCTAALAGKDVRVMLPAHSDKGILVPQATCSYFDRALSAGVRIFLYDAGYMHAKTIVADDRIASIGSVNIDPRSINLSFEINAFIYDHDIACQQRAIFEKDMLQCHEIDLDIWRKRPRKKRIVESFARLFAPMF